MLTRSLRRVLRYQPHSVLAYRHRLYLTKDNDLNKLPAERAKLNESLDSSKVKYNLPPNLPKIEELSDSLNYKEEQSKIFERIERQFVDDTKLNVSDRIAMDPRLKQFKPNSPEYKDMMNTIHNEIVLGAHENRKWWAFYERLKGVLAGVLALVAIVCGHQLWIRYHELKSKYYTNRLYKVDDNNIPNLNDDERNKKLTKNVVAQLESQLPAIEATVQPSSVPGLYVCGEVAGRLPARIPFFEGKKIRDVGANGQYLVVVDAKGKVYQRPNKTSEFTEVNIPKLSLVAVTEAFVVGLTTKGQVVYYPRSDVAANFKGDSQRSWTWAASTKDYATLPTSQSIVQLGVGAEHLLMLGNDRQVYVTSLDNTTNLGQYGTPQAPELGVETDVTLLNKELVILNTGDRSVVPRHFRQVLAGAYHNLALDTNDNVWAWGDNQCGQCAIDVLFTTNKQPAPRKILNRDDLKRLCRNFVDKASRSEEFNVRQVVAAGNLSYVEVDYRNQTLVLAFGNGVQGQLGTRYMHVCSLPLVIKLLTGFSEYDEKVNRVVPIGVDLFSGSGDHCIVTMGNTGPRDVLVFGDNEFGQLANGRLAKTTKPLAIPLLIEPNEVSDSHKLAERLADVNNSKLRMEPGQRIKALPGSTAIFYQ
ncbi:hypothetical protein JNB11_00590 [Kocuria palustris]|nr:hypothetical protein [Kocuria palustris]